MLWFKSRHPNGKRAPFDHHTRGLWRHVANGSISQQDSSLYLLSPRPIPLCLSGGILARKEGMKVRAEQFT